MVHKEFKKDVAMRVVLLSAALTSAFGAYMIGRTTLRPLLRNGAVSPPAPRNFVGTRMPTVTGHSITGEQVRLDFLTNKGATLLLAFSPTCGFCRKNFHNWRDIVSGVPADEVVYLDMSGTASREDMLAFGIPEKSSLIRLDPNGLQSGVIPGTPTTLVIDHDGIVRWAKSGVLTAPLIAEVRKMVASMRTGKFPSASQPPHSSAPV